METITETLNEFLISVGDAIAESGVSSTENNESNNTSENTDTASSETEQPDAPAENTITQNSQTTLLDFGTSRFSSAIWYRKIREKTVLLAGLGGIGSYVAFLLARIHPDRIIMYDPDFIEDVNMSGQLYSYSQLGLAKGEALASILRDFSNYYNITTLYKRYTYDEPSSDIMICGFDNMDSRKIFFNSWLDKVYATREEDRKHCLFIDGRLAAEEFQVLCIRGDDAYNIERYAKEWLFSSEEAESTVCSYKQTSFVAAMIGSIIVNLFINFCANDLDGEEHPIIDRDLPFLVSYDAKMMLFKTEC